MSCSNFEILIDEIGHKKVHFKCCDVFAEKRCRCKMKDCKHSITENGYTKEFEKKILKASKEYKNIKSYSSEEQTFKYLKIQ